ncbi:hypothetical protein D3C76_935730 [compost metagenome]
MHAAGQQPQRQLAEGFPRQFRLLEGEEAGVVQQAHARRGQFDHLEVTAVDLVQVAQSQVQLVAREPVDDLLRTQRRQLEAQLRVTLGQGLEQVGGVEAGQRYHAQAQTAHQLAPTTRRLGLQAIVSRQQGARPGEDALARLGETLEALAALHQHEVQLVLQIAQAHRQRGLGDVAERGGLAEVAGLVEGDEKLELLDVHGATLRSRVEAGRFVGWTTLFCPPMSDSLSSVRRARRMG